SPHPGRRAWMNRPSHTQQQARIGLRPAAARALAKGERTVLSPSRPACVDEPTVTHPAAGADRASPGRCLRPPVGGGAEGASGGVYLGGSVESPAGPRSLRVAMPRPCSLPPV